MVRDLCFTPFQVIDHLTSSREEVSRFKRIHQKSLLNEHFIHMRETFTHFLVLTCTRFIHFHPRHNYHPLVPVVDVYVYVRALD